MVQRHRKADVGRGPRIVGGIVLGRHLLLAALQLPLTAASPLVFGEILNRAEASLPADEALRDQTLVVVNTPHAFLSSFVPAARQAIDRPAPARLRTLGSSMDEVRVTRRGPRTVVLECPGGFLSEASQKVMWDPADRRDAGYKVVLDDVVVEVEQATDDGRPRVVAFHFVGPPDGPRYRWVTWSGDGFVPFDLPEVGQTVVSPAIEARDVILGSAS